MAPGLTLSRLLECINQIETVKIDFNFAISSEGLEINRYLFQPYYLNPLLASSLERRS